MDTENRICSIDIMRGLTLVLMLFLNDLYIPGLPQWLDQKPPNFYWMGLAGWVFPGFLFLAGMAIPLSIDKRISEGQNKFSIAKHILTRSISLLIIGVLMINSERVNPEFTGLGKNLWAILMFAGVFIIWNKYQENDKNFFTVAGLRLVGIAILVFLVFRFRSGEFENNGSLITSWWGIPGRIGWGYLIAAFIYLAVRGRLFNTIVAFLFFLSLNILTKLDLLNSLNPFKSIFGVILEGYEPFMVISGLLTSLILKKYSKNDFRKTIFTIVSFGILSIITGFILCKWFIIPDIQATPGLGLIYNGTSILIFALLYWIIDIKKHTRGTFLIKTAGENSLTTYLAPVFLYYLIRSTGLPVLIYKQSEVPLIIVAGSVIWALLMLGLTVLLVRYNIKLRL